MDPLFAASKRARGWPKADGGASTRHRYASKGNIATSTPATGKRGDYMPDDRLAPQALERASPSRASASPPLTSGAARSRRRGRFHFKRPQEQARALIKAAVKVETNALRVHWGPELSWITPVVSLDGLDPL